MLGWERRTAAVCGFLLNIVKRRGAQSLFNVVWISGFLFFKFFFYKNILVGFVLFNIKMT